MKKFLKLMVAMLAVCGIACVPENNGGNGGNDNGGNNGGNNTPSNTFVISVSDISTTGATVSVTPSTDESYYFDIVDKTYYDAYADKQAFLVDYIAEIKAYIDELAAYGYVITFADFVSYGPDAYAFDDLLDPGTEYYAIAFGLSTDGVATTAPTVKEFKTLSDGGNNGGGSSQNAFSISVSGVTATGVTVNVTPSNNDSYYFDVIEKSVFDSYNSPAAFAADYWAMVAEVYESYGYPISYALSQGSDGYTYEDSLDPNTEYYAFAFGVSTAGTITTGVTTKAFTTLGSGNTGGGSQGGDKNFTNLVEGYYTNYGDYYGVNAANWYIDLYTANTADVVVVELLTDMSATSFTGSYKLSSSLAVGSAVAGGEDADGYLYGSLWGLSDGDGFLSEYLLLKSGDVSISKSGSTYTLVLDAVADDGTSIKASYTGALEEWTDIYTMSRSSLNSFSSVARLQKAEHIANVKKLALKRVVRAKSTKLAAVKSNRVVKRNFIR